MFKVLIFTAEGKNEELCRELAQKDCACSVVNSEEELKRKVTEQTPDILLVESDSYLRVESVRNIKQETGTPVIALVDKNMLDRSNGYLDRIDDFLVKPYDLPELTLRIKRIIKTEKSENADIIRCGDLVIDVTNYEVFISGLSGDADFQGIRTAQVSGEQRRTRFYTGDAVGQGVGL